MKEIWNWLVKFQVRFLLDKFVLKRYKKAGTILGATLSDMLPADEEQCDEIQELTDRWKFWEKECARRKYRIMSLITFMNHGGWGRPLERFGEKAEALVGKKE